MPFQIGCPKCSREYTLADEMRGKAIRCKECAHAFRIPAATSQPAPNAQTRVNSQPPAQQAQRAQVQQPSARAAAPPPQQPAPAQAAASQAGGFTPLRSDNDVFTGQMPNAQVDPLANHVVANPGFTYVDPNKYVPKEETEVDVNSLYFNPAATELQKDIQREMELEQSHRLHWWPTFVGLAMNLVAIGMAMVSMLVMPDLAFLFLIGAIFVTGTISGIGEIWLLAMISRYDSERFTMCFLFPVLRYNYLSKNWHRHKDIGSFLAVGIFGVVVVVIMLFALELINN